MCLQVVHSQNAFDVVRPWNQADLQLVGMELVELVDLVELVKLVVFWKC